MDFLAICLFFFKKIFVRLLEEFQILSGNSNFGVVITTPPHLIFNPVVYYRMLSTTIYQHATVIIKLELAPTHGGWRGHWPPSFVSFEIYLNYCYDYLFILICYFLIETCRYCFCVRSKVQTSYSSKSYLDLKNPRKGCRLEGPQRHHGGDNGPCVALRSRLEVPIIVLLSSIPLFSCTEDVCRDVKVNRKSSNAVSVRKLLTFYRKS